MGRKKKGSSHDPSQFIYVDVTYENPNPPNGKGSRPPKWLRKKLDQVEEFKQQCQNFNVFSTVQRFLNPVHTEPELSYMPLYFDLDSDRHILSLIQMGYMTIDDVKPYLRAEHTALLHNYFHMGVGFENVKDKASDDYKLVMEMQAALPDELTWHANLSVSQSDARKIRTFFAEELDITGQDIRFYFSGRKGFHVLVSPEALGVEPRTDLNLVFKYIALYLLEDLKLEALDYGSIYSSRRMLRMNGSVHQKTKLFKTEITAEELDLNTRDIVALAVTPRPQIYAEDTAELDPIEKATLWYQYMVGQYEATGKAYNEKIIDTDVLNKMPDYPVCMQDILENGIKKSGDRNKATMVIASYFKDIGTPIEQTIDTAVRWLDKVKPEYTSSRGRDAEVSTRTSVKTVYDNDKYHFGCPFILSLHGERRTGSSNYEAVACAGRKCPLHQDYRKDREAPNKVHLSDSGNSEFATKKIATEVLVSGKMDTPYLVAKKVKYMCFNEDCQKPCVLREHGFVMEKEFAHSDRVLIEAAHQQDNNLKGIIKGHGGAACPKHTYEILEYANVEELLVVPMAERVSDIKEDDETHGGKIVDENGKEFVSRKIYYVRGDDDTDKIRTNAHYTFEGYVYPHPKNQMATILSQVATPLQNSIESFKVTDENRALASVFQVQPGETLKDRIDLILEDLTLNVTRVYERYEALLALLWTYHSIINFSFQGEYVQRGWLELLIVGDTGQAKTRMTSRLMNYAGLGDLIGGETASRTGILYTLDQIGDRWFITFGKYPLNDLRLLAVDEFSGLSDDDFSQMTEARSTGILKVTRKVTVETNTRVRLVLLSNPRWGKQLNEFQYGVESLKVLFKEASDIRRLDLAVFMATHDVPDDIINKERELPKERMISSEALKANILWAWSRKPHHVQMSKKVERLILKKASEMSEKYGSAKDIPIVIPEEERIKIARLAVANAAFRHSTDAETGEMVVVEERDVEFVVETLQHIFDAKNCRYDIYARNAKEETELTPEEEEAITVGLQNLDFADMTPISKEILDLFRRNDTMKPNELRDMTGYTNDQVLSRTALLSKYGMIKKTKNGLKVLPKFLEYLDKTRSDT